MSYFTIAYPYHELWHWNMEDSNFSSINSNVSFTTWSVQRNLYCLFNVRHQTYGCKIWAWEGHSFSEVTDKESFSNCFQWLNYRSYTYGGCILLCIDKTIEKYIYFISIFIWLRQRFWKHTQRSNWKQISKDCI